MSTKTKKSTPAIKKIETQNVTIKVAKDPEAVQGLRGLKGMVFAEFAKAFKAKKDINGMMDEMTEKVKAQYPQSRWVARPKIHFSYYKSKFLQSVKA